MSSGQSNLPSRRAALDRTALERILSRAAELQHSGAEGIEVYSEEQLVELGREVGLAPEHIRQAIAEERTRPLAVHRSGRFPEHFGPGIVEVRRILVGTPGTVMQWLERWMEREECLQSKRRFPDRVTWEPRRDFLGSVKRGFNIGGRGYALAVADEVAATVTPVDSSSVLVHLSADYTAGRKRAVGGVYATVGTVAVASTLLLGVAVTLGGSLILAGGACAVLGGVGSLVGLSLARNARELAMRGHLALEQALDRAEQAGVEMREDGGVLGSILDAAVRELR